MEKTIIIFSGYNQRAIVAFLRYIHFKVNNYVIIASSQNDDIFKSNYREKVIYTRKNKDLDLKEILGVVDSIQGEKIVMPTTEALNRFFLDNRKVFLEHYCIIPLVDKETYQLISDKRSFFELCKTKSITVPNIIKVSRQFPGKYVAKPQKYYNSSGKTNSPIIVLNEVVHDEFWRRPDKNEFDIQEYIEGESFYLLYYFDKKGRIEKFSQKNLLQQGGGKSIIAAISSNVHNEEVSLKYEKLFADLNFFGLVMVEIRKNQGKYYMIEANPRFWGPSQLFVDAGVNFFGLLLEDCGINVDIINSEQEARYYWSGGRSINEVWLENGIKIFDNNIKQFIKADIYNREDTKEIYENERNK